MPLFRYLYGSRSRFADERSGAIFHQRNAVTRSLFIFVIPLFFFTFVFLSGCGRSAPDDLISEDTYIDILAEIHLLAAIRERNDDKKEFRNLQDSILTQYSITRDQFERSDNYYYRDMEAQLQRFREVRKRLEMVSSKMMDHENELRRIRTTEQDTLGAEIRRDSIDYIREQQSEIESYDTE